MNERFSLTKTTTHRIDGQEDAFALKMYNELGYTDSVFENLTQNDLRVLRDLLGNSIS